MFPILPIFIFHMIYVIWSIVQNTDLVDLDKIKTEKDLDKHVRPHVESFYERYKIPLHILNAILWYVFIKYFIY
jgi:hypothetical protein